MNKALIILDRDGVINYESKEYIKNPDEWTAIPGSLEAIAQLNRAGYSVVIATNQSGIGRGYFDMETLDQIHEKLIHELASVGGYIEDIFFCPHHPMENCSCRKPQPAMFYNIQKKHAINLSDTYYIGDSATDIEVALKTGCKPILVLTGNGKKTLETHPHLASIEKYSDLASAVDSILKV